MNTLDFIMAYEGGELDEDAIIEGFQALVDSGLAWQLQGHYGRTAAALIEAGLVITGNRSDNSPTPEGV
jgi:hypothetical protein